VRLVSKLLRDTFVYNIKKICLIFVLFLLILGCHNALNIDSDIFAILPSKKAIGVYHDA
jgi:hypothetical protein